MRGAIYNGAKGDDFYDFVTNAKAPVTPPAPGSVNVRVVAVSLNPIDYKLPSIPFTGVKGKPVGRDFSGIITDPGSSAFKVGDEVFGASGSDGGLIEECTVSTSEIALKPESVSHVQAASLNVAGLTAYQALHTLGKLQPDGRVLIIGASGGCGGFAVQIARAIGASEIVGVCSANSAEYVKSLGATDVHDYNGTTALPAGKEGHFDVVFDTVSSPDDHDYFSEAIKLVRPKTGHYVGINGPTGRWIKSILSKALFVNLLGSNRHLLMVSSNARDLAQLSEWVAEGKLVPQIDLQEKFTAEGVANAFARQKSRRARGKIVVHVTDN